MGNACTTEDRAEVDFTDYFGVPLQDLVAFESRIRGTAYPCGSIVPFLLQDVATALQTAPLQGKPSGVKEQVGVDNRSLASSNEVTTIGVTSMNNSINNNAPVHPHLRTLSSTGFHADYNQSFDEMSVARLQQIKNAIVETAKRYKTHGTVASKFIVFGETLIEKQDCTRNELLNIILLFLVTLPNRPLTVQLCDEVSECMARFEKEHDSVNKGTAAEAPNNNKSTNKHLPQSKRRNQMTVRERNEMARARWKLARSVLKILTIESLERAGAKSDNPLFSKYPHLRKADEKGLKRRKSDAGSLDPKQVSIAANKETILQIKEEGLLFGHFRDVHHGAAAAAIVTPPSTVPSSRRTTLTEAISIGKKNVNICGILLDPYDLSGPGAGFGSLYCNANMPVPEPTTSTSQRKTTDSQESKKTKTKFLSPLDHPNHPTVRLFFWVLSLFNEMAPESHMLTFEQCCLVVAAMCEDRASIEAQQEQASERHIAAITHLGDGDKNKIPPQSIVAVELKGRGRTYMVLHPTETLKITDRIQRITQALLTAFCHRRPERLCRPEPQTAVAENEKLILQAATAVGNETSDSSPVKSINAVLSPEVASNNLIAMSMDMSSPADVTAPQSAVGTPIRTGKTVTVLDGPTAGPPSMLGVDAPTMVYDNEQNKSVGENDNTASMTASARTMAVLAAAKNAQQKGGDANHKLKDNNNLLAAGNKINHHRLPSQITEHLSGPNWPHQGSQDTSAILQTSSDSVRTGSPASDNNHTSNYRNGKRPINSGGGGGDALQSGRESSAESNQDNNLHEQTINNRTGAMSGILGDAENSKFISPTTQRILEADSRFDTDRESSRHKRTDEYNNSSDNKNRATRVKSGGPPHTYNSKESQHLLGEVDEAFEMEEVGRQVRKEADDDTVAKNFKFNGSQFQQRLALAKQGFIKGRANDLTPEDGKAFASETWKGAAERTLGQGVAAALQRMDEEDRLDRQSTGSTSPARSQLNELLAQLRGPLDGITGLPESMKRMSATLPPAITRNPSALGTEVLPRDDEDETKSTQFRQLCAVVELLEKDNSRLRSDLGTAMDDIGDAMERLHHDHVALKGMVGRSTAHRAFRERVQTILAEVADSQVTITEDAAALRGEVRDLREALLGAERDRNNLADEILALRAELEASVSPLGADRTRSVEARANANGCRSQSCRCSSTRACHRRRAQRGTVWPRGDYAKERDHDALLLLEQLAHHPSGCAPDRYYACQRWRWRFFIHRAFPFHKAHRTHQQSVWHVLISGRWSNGCSRRVSSCGRPFAIREQPKTLLPKLSML